MTYNFLFRWRLDCLTGGLAQLESNHARYLIVLQILISDLIPLAHRGTWFSINSVMWGVGTAIGPLVGAGFAQNVVCMLPITLTSMVPSKLITH